MAPPLKGTFFAFRHRAGGGVIAGATVTHILLMVASTIGFFALNRTLVGIVADGGVNDGTVSPLTTLLASIAPLFVYAIIMASYEAALLRWMIRGETDGFLGFSLGGDTWRVYAGYWLWFFVSGVIAVLTAVLAGYMFSAMGLEERSRTGDWWLGYVFYGAWILCVTPLALRLCAGNAASVARRKFSYFEGWRLSRGRSLELLGSFFALWFIWAALALAFFLGAAALLLLIFPEDPGAPDERTNGLMAVGLLLGLFLANIAMAFLSAGVNARVALAAIEDGKLDGVSTAVVNVFD